jgi:hypothetical protein
MSGIAGQPMDIFLNNVTAALIESPPSSQRCRPAGCYHESKNGQLCPPAASPSAGVTGCMLMGLCGMAGSAMGSVGIYSLAVLEFTSLS